MFKEGREGRLVEREAACRNDVEHDTYGTVDRRDLNIASHDICCTRAGGDEINKDKSRRWRYKKLRYDDDLDDDGDDNAEDNWINGHDTKGEGEKAVLIVRVA